MANTGKGESICDSNKGEGEGLKYKARMEMNHWLLGRRGRESSYAVMKSVLEKKGTELYCVHSGKRGKTHSGHWFHCPVKNPLSDNPLITDSTPIFLI